MDVLSHDLCTSSEVIEPPIKRLKNLLTFLEMKRFSNEIALKQQSDALRILKQLKHRKVRILNEPRRENKGEGKQNNID